MQRSHLSPKLLAACAAVCLGFMATPAMATFLADSSTDFSYTGTVTDPNGQVHTIIPYTAAPSGTNYTGRDASLYVTNDPTLAYTQFGTNWYSSLNGQNDGSGNPNNMNSGFVQLVDAGNTSVTSISGGWTDSNYTTFTIAISGGPTASSNYNRLWAAPNTAGAASTTAGNFLNYTFMLTATFAPGAVTEESPGWFSTTASPQSITGSFLGRFDNTGSLAPGQYGFDLTFLGANWAAANGIQPYDGSPYFAASAVGVPEPPNLILFGLFGSAVLGLGLLARRRRLN